MSDLCPGCDYRLVPFPEEKRRIDIGDYWGDYRKLCQAVGWEPTIGPREGLARMVRFYQENREHYWTEEAMR